MFDNDNPKSIVKVELPRELADELPGLLTHPEIRAIAEKNAVEGVARRKTLATALREVTLEKEVAACAKDERFAEEANAALKAAERAVIDARDKYFAAQAAAAAAAAPFRTERDRLERELLATADRRISRFREELIDLRRNRFHESYSWDLGKDLIGRTLYTNNMEDIGRANALLDAALADAAAMVLEPLSRAELTNRMQAWCGKLAPVLAKIRLEAPRVTDGGVERAAAMVDRDVVRRDSAAKPGARA